MSAALAKPAPSLKDLSDLANWLHYNARNEPEANDQVEVIVDHDAFDELLDGVFRLEGQPAAERTVTTKDIRDELESTYRLLMDDADFIDEQHPALAISIKGDCDSIKKCIDALNAQERAGA